MSLCRRTLLFCWLGSATVVCLLSGCTDPAQFKAQADEEAYQIIDSKWQDNFGQKANYTVSDAEPSPNDIRIEEPVRPSDIISLTEAVALATAQNRVYQNQKEILYLEALNLSDTRHTYARRWFTVIDGEYSRELELDAQNTTIHSDGTTEDIGISTGSGFSQQHLFPNGIIIDTSIAIDWLRFLTGDPRTSLATVLSASIEAPLLGNGAGRLAWEELTQDERNVLYKIRSFARFRKDFVVSIVSDYYRVLQQRDAVTNAENNYKRRVESRERLEAEAEAGRRASLEVDQAQQRELDAKDSFVRARQRYEQLLDEFKITLALPTDVQIELDQNELKTLADIGISQPDYNVDIAIETALLGRLDLATSRDKIDDRLRKVMLAVDGLGPQLDLLGDIGIDSSGDTDFSRLRFHEAGVAAGFEADLPLDRKLQRNNYRRSLIALEQQKRQYENDEDEIKLQVRQAYRQLLEKAQQYYIRKNSLALAQKRVDSVNLLLEAGRAKTRDLLEAQDDLIVAQNALTGALVDHSIAKLNFFKDIGILQVRPDGMWQY